MPAAETRETAHAAEHTDRDAHARLRTLLRRALWARPTPVLAGIEPTPSGSRDFAVPGATIWSAARTWVHVFRALGLSPGDRVVLALAPSRAHVAATIAAWWEGLTLCPIAERDARSGTVRAFSPSLLITQTGSPAAASVCPVLHPGPAGEAPSEPSLRAARRLAAAEGNTPPEPSTGIALILSTSGSGGAPKRIALSYTNLVHQLTTHVHALAITPADRAVACLPWHHAFGLLVDLWPALLSGATVRIDPAAGRSAEDLLRLLNQADATRCGMVPLQAQRLLDLPGGPATVRRLAGVIGGAPIPAALATALAGSRLRVGYGQTECAPGVTLGRPGEFTPAGLGRPIGCQAAITDGELCVRGSNVHAGTWDGRGLTRLPAGRWHRTGDLVAQDIDGNLTHLGRTDHRFKLPNGRMIDAPAIERTLEAALEEHLPGVAAIVTPSAPTESGGYIAGLERALDVTILLDPHAGFPLPRSMNGSSTQRLIDAALGPLARIAHPVRALSAIDAPRTRKGEVDRAAIARLRESGSAAQPIQAAAAA